MFPDQVFGIIIIGLLPVQLFFGWYHHHRFVLDQPSSRRWFTHVHLWLGRLIILFGLANCGFGLREAFVSGIYIIAWWVVCAVLAIAYAVVSFVTFRQRAKKTGEGFGNAKGPVFSPERYSKMESYEMMNGSRENSPPRGNNLGNSPYRPGNGTSPYRTGTETSLYRTGTGNGTSPYRTGTE